MGRATQLSENLCWSRKGILPAGRENELQCNYYIDSNWCATSLHLHHSHSSTIVMPGLSKMLRLQASEHTLPSSGSTLLGQLHVRNIP